MEWTSSNMAEYVPPKEFMYVKNDMEFITDWKKQHPEANCYYCGKSREDHEMEFLFLEAPEGLGICRLCFIDFRIGHLWTDRFVVQHILANYNRRSDVVRWFQRNGYEMFEAGSSNDHEGDWEAYSFINNPDRYFEFMKKKHKGEPLPDGGYLTPDEASEMNELLEERTYIKIFKDGAIEIMAF